ncbi:MAG: bifunctional DNA-formamidopyrimidine glycosylase/DNA-(apurinic or apyrimidinic site) lyase [Lactobacillaceae bacterium]|jgi:formamidopyrimidine-DNA glycosylase|nr:bifunctional DNA-formamidopyrimidine glycosylase/DNA-(apurinic or apyrimidinic site) lyase [Lactobacillaceae bacterium]
MPELPEVETVRRGLEGLVIGKKIVDINLIYQKLIVGDPNEFIEIVKNNYITSIDRRGKFLFIRLSNSMTIISHLRMEGKYSVNSENEMPNKHTEIIFKLDNQQQIFYDDTRKFGKMQLSKTGFENITVESIDKMGPEPTETDLSAEYLFNQLQKSKKEIKAWLLDQSNVAGIGNIYADEILWLSKIHPLTPANHLNKKDASTLRNNIIEELNFAISKRGSTVHSFKSSDGKEGEMQNFLHAYGRKGLKCERDGNIMEKIRVAQRGTTFCEVCQRLK